MRVSVARPPFQTGRCTILAKTTIEPRVSKLQVSSIATSDEQGWKKSFTLALSCGLLPSRRGGMTILPCNRPAIDHLWTALFWSSRRGDAGPSLFASHMVQSHHDKRSGVGCLSGKPLFAPILAELSHIPTVSYYWPLIHTIPHSFHLIPVDSN